MNCNTLKRKHKFIETGTGLVCSDCDFYLERDC